MNRSETIRIRVSPAENETIQRAAARAGMSVSEFARRAMKRVGPGELGGTEPSLANVFVPQKVNRKAPPIESVIRFRTPFLRGVEGAGFERAVRHAARNIRADEMTVAMALTYFAEGVSHAMISGQIVRFPGLFVAGPYAAEDRRGRTRVWPRFQASPPLSRTVDSFCTPDLARNYELDAHGRRSRRKGVQTVTQVMETFRRAIVNQDLRIFHAMEDRWRDSLDDYAT